MKLLILVICVFICVSLDVNTSSGQGHEAVEELKSFSQQYSSWQRQKRKSVDYVKSNASVDFNLGFRQEKIEYWASEEKVDFYTGFIKCKQQGMEPVTIITMAQNNAFEMFLKPLVKPDFHTFWMGAKKVGDNGKIHWLNTGQPLAYTKWFASYPDNWSGNRNCLSYVFSETRGPGWNDVKCNIVMRYACQRRRSSIALILNFDREYPSYK